MGFSEIQFVVKPNKLRFCFSSHRDSEPEEPRLLLTSSLDIVLYNLQSIGVLGILTVLFNVVKNG